MLGLVTGNTAAHDDRVGLHLSFVFVARAGSVSCLVLFPDDVKLFVPLCCELKYLVAASFVWNPDIYSSGRICDEPIVVMHMNTSHTNQ